MKNQIEKTALIIVLLFAFASCINIPVGPEKMVPYKNVTFKPPVPDFSKSLGTPSDHSWINDRSGSMISYKSECSKQSLDADDTLKNIANEFYSSTTTEVQTFKFNSRKAYRQKLTTEVEGVKTNFDIVVFKKYGCLFLITHSGLASNFSSTQKSFQEFLVAFEVQR
jgi:hypothetical protein